MSGPELAPFLEKLRPAISRVLYMSGYPDDAVVQHGVLGPGSAFVQKPPSPDAILGRVRVLDGPSLEDTLA